MPESLQARRSLIFQNPGLSRGTSHTINMGVQMIVPGEVAWAHRHSIAALRFIVEGDPDLTTIVDGQHCVMQQGDLILTPNWSWHDHHNKSNKRALWLDVLDVPLVLSLNQTMYEPATGPDQPATEPARMRPTLRYGWAEAEVALRASPVGVELGQVHEYRDPRTGGPTLPTLMCSLVRLPPGYSGSLLRHTASSVWFVVRGEGLADVGETQLAWSTRDSFVIPNWSAHRLSNRSEVDDAVLFCVSDRPALEALGLYREKL
jgi:gentisate 1,2-dioxygenase